MSWEAEGIGPSEEGKSRQSARKRQEGRRRGRSGHFERGEPGSSRGHARGLALRGSLATWFRGAERVYIWALGGNPSERRGVV